MPTAAAPPPVRRKREARRASPRVLAGAAIVLALIVAALVAALVVGGGKATQTLPARGSLANALTGAADVQRLFAGIPQHGTVLGSPNAAVTMVEYVDLQCPFCQQFETQVLPTVIQRYVRTGVLEIDARPIAIIGPDSERGRTGALAAGLQNRLFNFSELLYVNQRAENTGWLSDQLVGSAAASIPGLDVQRLLADRSSKAVSAQEKAIDGEAVADHVSATPTILVGKTGSKPHVVALRSAVDLPTLVAAITAAAR